MPRRRNTRAGLGRRFGRTLVRWGAVTEAQLKEALTHQHERGGLIGRWLVETGAVSPGRMRDLLDRFHRRRHLSVANLRIDREVLRVLTKDLAWAWCALPLDISDGDLVVAVPDASETECVATLADATGMTIQPVSCPEDEIAEAIRRHYGSQGVIPDEWLFGSAPLSKFRFETYVVGEANRRVYEAAMAVAVAPGVRHNPLFVYGEVGHGKTHLLNAIGNRIREERPSSIVLYLPAVRFADELLRAIEHNRLVEFRTVYARTTVLLLDDVQFLADQRAVQEEFANLFEVLQARGRQIVITSDRAPEEVQTLADRVKSGLGAGLIVGVEVPSIAMKAAILMEKRREHKWALPDNVITRVAHEFDGDVRRLEGILRTVCARIELDSGRPMDEILSSVLTTVHSDTGVAEPWESAPELRARTHPNR
ncbi:ATP-binding protein [Candidatus Fermentibacteria bacterium]|nr:ATP-binding protein [Candidatus Fermentibacteria bacterium]